MSLRALTISSHGDLDHVEFRRDIPDPGDPREGEVRLRITAAALNHLDLFVVKGLPSVTITPPWILGGDATGVVEQVGASVDHVTVGDTVIVNPGVSCGKCEYCLDGEQSLCIRYRLLGEHMPGTMVEHIVLPATNVRAVPASIPLESRAAFTLATLTAWRMLVTRARLKEGEDILIWGIGGGVALQAMQIAVNLGARVWVASGSHQKLERARQMGAHETLHHGEVDVVREIRSRTGKRGMDVVVDSIGTATWERSLGVLGRRGRLVTCGGTSGPFVQTDVRRLFWNQWSILGSTMGNEAEFDAVAEELRAGRLLPVVDSVFPLEEGRAAFVRLASGEQFGKVVVQVAEGAPAGD